MPKSDNGLQASRARDDLDLGQGTRLDGVGHQVCDQLLEIQRLLHTNDARVPSSTPTMSRPPAARDCVTTH
ncbi:MAG TPA: hypothetical protein VIL97_11790 [Thermoanaerobaculia bacterium]